MLATIKNEGPISSKRNQWIRGWKRHRTDQREREKEREREEEGARGNRRRKRGTRSDESPRESGFQLSWSSHVIATRARGRRKGSRLDLDPGSRLASIVSRSRGETEKDDEESSRRIAEKRGKLWAIIWRLLTCSLVSSTDKRFENHETRSRTHLRMRFGSLFHANITCRFLKSLFLNET